MHRTLLLSAIPFVLNACTGPVADASAVPAPPASTRVVLSAANGAPRGTATMSEGSDGLSVRVDAAGLPPGVHGIHLHTVGRCDPPAFSSAGPHWNPTGAQHGRENPKGAHTGDLPNIIIGADGRGTLSFKESGATVAGLLDADGSALIIHADADDYKTDPSGNSGARIACGVVGTAR